MIFRTILETVSVALKTSKLTKTVSTLRTNWLSNTKWSSEAWPTRRAYREDIDGGADDILSVAPGESKTPISITKDEFFEEMFNPTKYPSGNGGLKTP